MLGIAHCDRDALPTELLPRKRVRNISSKDRPCQSIACPGRTWARMWHRRGNYMIKAGERAPEFTLPDETATDRSLTEFLSAGPLVLYFYPADFTPGCTRQACV